MDRPDQDLSEQYQDSTNLNARVRLHERFSTNRYGWHRWVFDQLRLPPRCRILELGCGPGYLWRENGARVPRDWEIILSDRSPGMLSEARHGLDADDGAFRFAVVDAQSIPFADGGFDAVIANHMLYHVPNREQALAEIRRVLRPGGRFYATTVGRSHMGELHALINRVVGASIYGGDRFSAPFTLENGAEQIARWFSQVELRRYDDALVVTEAEPLIAYAASGMAKSLLVGDHLAALTREVNQELVSKGAVRITKDSGLFEAR